MHRCFYNPLPRSYSYMLAVLLVCSLSACAGIQQRQATGPGATPAEQEARLQALESGMQQLSQRLDAVQARISGEAYGAVLASAPARPPEATPVRPTVVLAGNTIRQSAQPVAPAPVPVAEPPVEAAPEPAPRPIPVQPAPRDGDWVINLASYRNSSYATRKQAEFARKGVTVEQVSAEVKGKTIYRLRVPGFTSSRAANSEAAELRTRLGLASTWVARR